MRESDIDPHRIPNEVKPALEHHESLDPTPIEVFQNALREYWTIAAGAYGPNANADASEAAHQLSLARKIAAQQGVDIDTIEALFRETII